MTRATRSNPMLPAPTMTDSTGSSTVPVALFMPLAAPQLKSTSHASLVQWRKLRREYETEVAMRCNIDANRMAEVLVSVKKSFDNRLLAVWFEFDWEVNVDTVSDEFILPKIDEIISTVKNNSVPDVAALFKENVTIDMTESDVNERIMQIFARSREFVEEQGWQEFFTGNEGIRLKCKLLMKSLQPRCLRDEVTTTVKYQARTAKDSERELLKLILAKALEQDRDFQRRKRSRTSDHSDHKRKDSTNDNDPSRPRLKHRKVERTDGKRPAKAVIRKQSTEKQKNSKPPTGGCLKCKGGHWLTRCPTATDDEKKDILREMHERRDNNKGMKPNADA